MSKKVFLWEVAAVLVAVLTTIFPFFMSWVDCDSTYYICVAERIADGYVLYHDLIVGYTPLWLYIAAAFKTIFHVTDGSYLPYLALHYAFLLGVCYSVYQLAKEFKASQPIAFFAAWYTFMVSHAIYGHCVLLEVPSMFFGMLSLWLLVHYKDKSVWHYLGIGMLASCAFLVKQYGLVFFALDIFAIVWLTHKRWKNAGLLLLGYSVPILLAVAYFGRALIDCCIFSGYGTNATAGAEADLSFKIASIVLWGSCFMLLICPIVIPSFFYFKQTRSERHYFPMLLSYAGIMGFSVQFFFGSYGHYMLYMVPFGALLLSTVLRLKDEQEDWIIKWKKVAVRYMIIAPIIFNVGFNNIFLLGIQKQSRHTQAENAELVHRYIPQNAVVWITDYRLYYLYLLGHIVPPNISTIGYSFGHLAINEEQAFMQAKASDWVAQQYPPNPVDKYFTDSLASFLKIHETISLRDGSLLLYKMK